MQFTPEEELAIKDAMKGKISDNYEDLEKVLANLAIKKSNTTAHGTYKFIEKAMQKIDSKMRAIKAK